MNRPRIILIGAVDSTRVAFEAVVEAQCALDLVITLPLERSGMHSDFVDLAPLAARHDVELLETHNANSDAVVERVRALNPDFIFVIGWSRLVGEALRACAAQGVLGYHPAPLPKGRGRSALAWTILLGMHETAGSLFWIDEGVDSGPIAAQQAFPLAPRVDLPTLYEQHLVALKEMLGSLLARLKAGEIPAQVQDASHASYFAMRRAEDGRIDWSADAEDIDRLVRAVTKPYPGAFTTWERNRLMVWRGEPVGAPEWHAQTGQVFRICDGALYVRCGGGSSFRIDDYELLGEDGEPLPPLKGQPRLGDRGGTGHA